MLSQFRYLSSTMQQKTSATEMSTVNASVANDTEVTTDVVTESSTAMKRKRSAAFVADTDDGTLTTIEKKMAPTSDLFVLAADKCAVARELIDSLPLVEFDSGWWIFFKIKRAQLLASFESNEKCMEVFDDVISLLSKYYVKADVYLRTLCRERGVDENMWQKTDDEIIKRFREKYAPSVHKSQYICLDIPRYTFSEFVIKLSFLAVSISLLKMSFKNSSIQASLMNSWHIPLFSTFDQDPEELFSYFSISLNTQLIKAMNDGRSSMVDDTTPIPILKISGYVILLCELVDSVGQNSSGKKFKTLRPAESSKLMLTVHFNNYLRKYYPSAFPDSVADVMFIQVSESQTSPLLQWLEPQAGQTNNVLVFANLADLYLLENRNRNVPCLKMWANVKISS